jgi:colanic acid biosynthesis protein WcaH
MNEKIIPNELYKEILENMPICCVDIVIYAEKNALLIKRVNEPEKGEWWVSGGRIKKGEDIEEAVKRIVREEIGLEIKEKRFLGVYEYHSDKTNFKDVKTGTHSIVMGYAVEILRNSEVRLDKTSSEYKWINHIEDELKPYVKNILKASGVLN